MKHSAVKENHRSHLHGLYRCIRWLRDINWFDNDIKELQKEYGNNRTTDKELPRTTNDI
jgi:hypothetical protein